MTNRIIPAAHLRQINAGELPWCRLDGDTLIIERHGETFTYRLGPPAENGDRPATEAS